MAYVLHPRTISPRQKKTQSETYSTKQRKQDKNKVLNAQSPAVCDAIVAIQIRTD